MKRRFFALKSEPESGASLRFGLRRVICLCGVKQIGKIKKKAGIRQKVVLLPCSRTLPAAAGPDHETAETHIPAANPAAALRRSGRVVRLRAERNAVAVGQTGPHDRQPAGLRLPEGAAYRRTAASVERERPDSRPGVRDQRQAVRRIPQVQTRLGHPLHGAQRPAGASSGRPPQGLSFGNPPGGTLLVDGHVHRGEADAGLDRPPVGAPRHAGDLLQGLQPFLPAIRGFQRTETLPRAGGTLSGFGDHVCRHGFGALQARPALPDEPAATSRTKWRSGCSGF